MKNHFTSLKLVSAALFAIYCNASQAQKIYATLGTGYGFSAAPNLFSASDYTSDNNNGNSTKTEERKKGNGSFGKGMQFTGALGYQFTESISGELGLSYLSGSKIKSIYKSTNNSSSANSNYKSEMIIQGSVFRCMPTLRFTVGEGKTKAYMKAGAVIGLTNKLKTSSSSVYTFNDFSGLYSDYTESQTAGEYKGNMSLGFTAALGLVFKLSESVGFFTEVNMITQSWAPKKYSVTKSTSNGEDQLPGMKTEDKETEFVDSYTEGEYHDENTPTKELKFHIPFSSIGLQVGLHFNF